MNEDMVPIGCTAPECMVGAMTETHQCKAGLLLVLAVRTMAPPALTCPPGYPVTGGRVRERKRGIAANQPSFEGFSRTGGNELIDLLFRRWLPYLGALDIREHWIYERVQTLTCNVPDR